MVTAQDTHMKLQPRSAAHSDLNAALARVGMPAAMASCSEARGAGAVLIVAVLVAHMDLHPKGNKLPAGLVAMSAPYLPPALVSPVCNGCDSTVSLFRRALVARLLEVVALQAAAGVVEQPALLAAAAGFLERLTLDWANYLRADQELQRGAGSSEGPPRPPGRDSSVSSRSGGDASDSAELPAQRLQGFSATAVAQLAMACRAAAVGTLSLLEIRRQQQPVSEAVPQAAVEAAAALAQLQQCAVEQLQVLPVPTQPATSTLSMVLLVSAQGLTFAIHAACKSFHIVSITFSIPTLSGT